MGNQRDMGGGRVASQSIPFMNINHPTLSIGDSKENTTLAELRKGISSVCSFICQNRHRVTCQMSAR